MYKASPVFFPLVLTALLVAQPVSADVPTAPPTSASRATIGAVVGLVRNPAKLPVAGATVTALRTDGGGVRATVSDGNGMYSFPDLPSGAWSITFQADGYPVAAVPAIVVVPNQATRVDIMMTGLAAIPAAAAATQAATVPEALQAPGPRHAVDTQTP